LQVGIDSYSYHRRYGEQRAGEAPSRHGTWPLEPSPVLRHAVDVGADVVFLETCYLPAPEEITATILAPATDHGVEVGFSWGHPWPNGAFHGLDGGRSPGAEVELRRWVDTCERLGHDLLRITAGSPASIDSSPHCAAPPTMQESAAFDSGSRTMATCAPRMCSPSWSGWTVGTFSA
jgi:hypothetical protein